MGEEYSEAEAPQEHRFPCGSCGAKLEYQPGTENLLCQYCGHENIIEVSEEQVEELDFHTYLSKLEAEAPAVDQSLVKCDACAAEIERPPNLAAFSCPFCDSNIVTEGGSTRRVIKPESLLPFRLDAQDARKQYKAWLGKLWFAPSALTERAREDGRFDGVYLPYWTYDAETESSYTGQRGDDYWVTETYTTRDSDGNAQTQTRQVRRTRWSHASGRVFVPFDDVLVTGSKALPQKYLQELAPWDLEELRPFEESYLSGFKAETYQVTLVDGFQVAKAIMDVKIRAVVCADIGGDHQQISTCTTRHDNLTFKHVLLPVWISAFKYKDKTYRMVVNARTGEVQGERPYSALKIFFTVIGILAVIAAIVLAVQ